MSKLEKHDEIAGRIHNVIAALSDAGGPVENSDKLWYHHIVDPADQNYYAIRVFVSDLKDELYDLIDVQQLDARSYEDWLQLATVGDVITAITAMEK